MPLLPNSISMFSCVLKPPTRTKSKTDLRDSKKILEVCLKQKNRPDQKSPCGYYSANTLVKCIWIKKRTEHEREAVIKIHPRYHSFFLGKASQPFRKRPPTSREAFRTQKTAIMETEIIMINKLMSYMRLKPKALHE